MPEAEQGLNVARIASLRAGLPVEASAVTINRFCASGLQAIAFAADRIKRGLGERDHRRRHREHEHGADGRQQDRAESRARRQLSRCVSDDRTGRGEPRARSRHLARRAGRVRASQPSAGARGDRRGKISSTRRSRSDGFARDEGPRRDTSLEALAKLRPAFHVNGTVTAGNSSQMSDGAAAVLVTSEQFARERESDAAGALRRVCDRRRRAGALRHGPGSRHTKRC